MQTGTITLGHTKREKVKVAFMPRSQFLQLVEETIEYANVRVSEAAELRDTAQDMEHFPLGVWMTARGCGCLVGEALVARGLIDRTTDNGTACDLARQYADLCAVGNDIDRRVRDAVDSYEVDAVVLVD